MYLGQQILLTIFAYNNPGGHPHMSARHLKTGIFTKIYRRRHVVEEKYILLSLH